MRQQIRSIGMSGGVVGIRCLKLHVDYSSIGLEKTKRVYAKNDCSIKTIQADFFDWNPGKEKFDLIVHWGVLEHFQDPHAILKLCSEWVKPGGLLPIYHHGTRKISMHRGFLLI